MNEEKDEVCEEANSKCPENTTGGAAAPVGARFRSDGASGTQQHPSNGGSSIANRIAAFASGVAPVRNGLTNAGEDSITVEEVLHKLESVVRVAADGKAELPLPLVRSSYEHLVTARDDASRLSKELAELKSSRVQHIPPSAWVKREHKYKMDLEKYEHTINMQQQRIERLELEVQLLREGSNVKPLEERIQLLEKELMAASEEKTQVQSKYHELSIKHRQLIETSPQVATIWNEVLVQQAAAHGDAAAMQRLCNFDLRHTGANSGLSMPAAAAPAAAGSGVGREVSPRKLYGVSAAAAIFSQGVAPPAPVAASALAAAATGPQLLETASIEQGPETPVLSVAASSPMSGGASRAAGARGGAAAAAGPQSSEDRANALMAAVALEGLSPEASFAALQQLNYDLTMQLGLYQQMVARLKDAMEQSDLEKAEIEADKTALEAQLAATNADILANGTSGGAASVSSSRAGRWGLFWRRANTVGGEDGDGEGSLADVSSTGLASLSSSRRSSMDFDAAVAQQGGSPLSAAQQAARDAASTPTHGGDEGSEQQQQQQHPSSSSGTPVADGGGDGGSSGGQAAAGPHQQQQQQQQQQASPEGVLASPTAQAATPARAMSGGLFGARRARAAARAASAAENLGKELKELKRQLTSVQEENKFLVQNLVEIKMELAETQSSHDQAKRALVRAMDKEACLDMRVTELTHMLDMVTSQQAAAAAASNGNGLVGMAGAAASAAMAVAGAAASAAGAEIANQKSRRVAAQKQRAAQSGDGDGSAISDSAASGPGSELGSGELTESGSGSEGVDDDVIDDDAVSGAAVEAHSISAASSSSSDEYDSTVSRSNSTAGEAAAAAQGEAGSAQAAEAAVVGTDAAGVGSSQQRQAQQIDAAGDAGGVAKTPGSDAAAEGTSSLTPAKE